VLSLAVNAFVFALINPVALATLNTLRILTFAVNRFLNFFSDFFSAPPPNRYRSVTNS
jgi:hypothetical protein